MGQNQKNLVISALEEAKKVADQRLNALNAINSEEEPEEFADAQTALSTAVVTLNAEERASQFAEMLADPSPVMAAIMRGVLNLTVVKAPSKKSPQYIFEFTTDIIDLTELSDIYDVAHVEDTNYKPVFNHAQAALYVEALNRFFLAYEVKKGDGKVTKKWEKFNMTVTAGKILEATLADVNCGKDFTPLTQKVTNTLVDGIELDPEIVEYWAGKYAPYSKTINGVKPTAAGAFRKYFMRLLNKTMTGNPWIVE